jgi:hypothetical protein
MRRGRELLLIARDKRDRIAAPQEPTGHCQNLVVGQGRDDRRVAVAHPTQVLWPRSLVGEVREPLKGDRAGQEAPAVKVEERIIALAARTEDRDEAPPQARVRLELPGVEVGRRSATRDSW